MWHGELWSEDKTLSCSYLSEVGSYIWTMGKYRNEWGVVCVCVCVNTDSEIRINTHTQTYATFQCSWRWKLFGSAKGDLRWVVKLADELVSPADLGSATPVGRFPPCFHRQRPRALSLSVCGGNSPSYFRGGRGEPAWARLTRRPRLWFLRKLRTLFHIPKNEAETSDGIKELLSTGKVRRSALVRVCVCVFTKAAPVQIGPSVDETRHNIQREDDRALLNITTHIHTHQYFTQGHQPRRQSEEKNKK